MSSDPSPAAAKHATSFGDVAQAYDRYRPGYPDQVVEVIQSYARRPVRTVLDIGAGTGKATSLLQGHGLQVTALEPDEGMLAVLRDRVPAASTVLGALETVRPLGVFDLVVAAASLHWTHPGDRWGRICSFLPAGGVVAILASPIRIADAQLAERVQQTQALWVPPDALGSMTRQDSPAGMRWPGTEMQAWPGLCDVEQYDISRRLSFTREECVGYLDTLSAYRVLAPLERQGALGQVAAVLPDRVEILADVHLHLGRRQ